jgi:hypothetical protein
MPGITFESDNDDFDSQDQSEAFDESNLIGDGDSGEVRSFGEADIRSVFEELPDVEDLTQADGDRDDDEALALDADAFDPDAIGEDDLEADDELDYRAATEEHEDDLDGLGPQGDLNGPGVTSREIDGLEEVRDASEVEGGEDDFTDFQARGLSDEDLKALGYSEDRAGETRAKPDRP